MTIDDDPIKFFYDEMSDEEVDIMNRLRNDTNLLLHLWWGGGIDGDRTRKD